MKLYLVALTRRAVIAVLFVNMIVGSAVAGAWHVEQDGSGDWSTLQEATDAAAHGDTILVGPGRYIGVAVSPSSPSHYQSSFCSGLDQRSRTQLKEFSSYDIWLNPRRMNPVV